MNTSQGGAKVHIGCSTLRGRHSYRISSGAPFVLNTQGWTVSSIFDFLGGEAGVRRLVDRFYDLMETAPEAATVRALHPELLEGSREKLFLFLTGWSGGPQLYVERYGHPRLRMRHLPFSIGERERDEWLWCMDKALAETDLQPEVRDFLSSRFHAIADHMRNRPEES